MRSRRRVMVAGKSCREPVNSTRLLIQSQTDFLTVVPIVQRPNVVIALTVGRESLALLE